MKLIIDIDDRYYELVKRKVNLKQWEYIHIPSILIANGTPLPKEHGDLITKEQAIDLVEFYQLNPQHFDFVNLIDEIKDEKPIIEAAGGSDDE